MPSKTAPRSAEADLELEEDSTTDAAEEQVDWEARYKGQQKVIGRKDAQLVRLQQRVSELEGTHDAEATQYETQVIELRAQLKTLQTAAQGYEAQLAQATAEKAALARQQQVRKVLSNPENQLTELLPWYEEGHFAVSEDADDAAVLAKAQSFKKLLGGNVSQAIKQSAEGTRPQGAAAGGSSAGMTADEMRSWLFANPSHADYEKVEDQYFEALSKAVR